MHASLFFLAVCSALQHRITFKKHPLQKIFTQRKTRLHNRALEQKQQESIIHPTCGHTTYFMDTSHKNIFLHCYLQILLRTQKTRIYSTQYPSVDTKNRCRFFFSQNKGIFQKSWFWTRNTTLPQNITILNPHTSLFLRGRYPLKKKKKKKLCTITNLPLVLCTLCVCVKMWTQHK